MAVPWPAVTPASLFPTTPAYMRHHRRRRRRTTICRLWLCRPPPSRIRTMADAAEDTSPAAAEPQGVGKGEEGTKDEEEGESLRERARVEESKQQTALLFMRRPPGHYVFCGRLEAVNGGGGGGGEDGNPVGWLRLVDTAPLRSSSTFHQLIGCRLLPEAPAAEVQEV